MVLHLARSEVGENTLDLEGACERRRGEPGEVARPRTEAPEPGIDLEVHPQPPPRGYRRGECRERLAVPGDDREPELDGGPGIGGGHAPEHQDRGDDPAATQLVRLVERRHREHLCAPGEKPSRNRRGTVSVGVRLHDRTDADARPDKPSDLAEVVGQSVEIDRATAASLHGPKFPLPSSETSGALPEGRPGCKDAGPRLSFRGRGRVPRGR